MNALKETDVESESAVLMHKFLAWRPVLEQFNIIHNVGQHAFFYCSPFLALHRAANHCAKLACAARWAAMHALHCGADRLDDGERGAYKAHLETELDDAHNESIRKDNIVTGDPSSEAL